MYDEAFEKLFWSKVKKTRSCWLWTAGKQRSGYGQIQCRRFSSQPLTAHRVSWRLTRGEIPAGMHVLHTCDNPACVNPLHLFLGNAVLNALDRDAKGRTASGNQNGARTRPERNPFIRNHGSGLRGESHPQARLTDRQVAAIRKEFASGTIKAKLARKYGVSQTHIGRILKGRLRT